MLRDMAREVAPAGRCGLPSGSEHRNLRSGPAPGEKAADSKKVLYQKGDCRNPAGPYREPFPRVVTRSGRGRANRLRPAAWVGGPEADSPASRPVDRWLAGVGT